VTSRYECKLTNSETCTSSRKKFKHAIFTHLFLFIRTGEPSDFISDIVYLFIDSLINRVIASANLGLLGRRLRTMATDCIE
jgi:hypothetical protein